MTVKPDRPLVTAFECMTISCPEPGILIDMLVKGMGWEILADVSPGGDMEQAWGIATGSAGPRAVVVRSVGANRGMIRVVSGVERPRAKAKAARWAGAEILVTRDIDEVYDRLVAFPDFRSMGEPENVDFSEFASNVHRYFHGFVPGGTHLTLTMAVTQPEGRDFPQSDNQVGHIFEVPLSSGTYEATTAFYCDVLGLETILTSFHEKGAIHKAWGLPDSTPYHLDIHKGYSEGTGLGGVEVHGCPAEFIDPEPADPAHFDGGACMATYVSDDIDAAYNAVAASADAVVLSKPLTIEAAPYNGMRAFVFLGPGGERVEVCEKYWA